MAVKSELSPLICARIEVEAAHASADRMQAEAARMREELHSAWAEVSDARKKALEGVDAKNATEVGDTAVEPQGPSPAPLQLQFPKTQVSPYTPPHTLLCSSRPFTTTRTPTRMLPLCRSAA